MGEGKTLTLALDTVLPQIPKENDKAFVQALCYGVLRWYFRLDFWLATLSHKPVKDLNIRLLALLGLYQLRYTRVKPHAAVSETVAAAQPKAWAKPLLNAILRAYQRQQTQLETSVESNPEALYGHPAWMIDQFKQDWPEHALDILRHHNEPPPMALRVNLARIARDAYLESLAQIELAAYSSELCETAITLETPVAVNRLPGFHEGLVSVQDTAAQLAVPLMNLQPGQRILDLCAAPGGKTLHILESSPLLKELVAIDIIPERVHKIRENLDRGDYAATLLTADASQPENWWDGAPFDRILLDAPCSATGIIRRHPDIKLLRKPQDLVELQNLQKQILEATWPMLAPGGELLYATCSILRQENELRITEFLKHHPDAQEVPLKNPWGIPVAHGRQILTGESGMDGFYFARIKKVS
jgi:16S rRNA (cytosine967-C5)-methyltransferase